ncbi:hypothetical protein [uncultured Pontibacter sp.]|uniref:hypothetical protein n=1 Tax=uncultured Pontibacter sp. TaxID=453356 RepID=UPI002605DAE4|nr:hypothetical protein [uncultured Pontibacter sp.]
MRQQENLRGKTLRLLLLSGIFIPFLVASFTSQTVGANFLEIAMIFSMVFLFSSLAYWIIARTIVQLLED